MKLNPTAIRQKTFDTSFRGFEKKDVSDFLAEVAEVVDQLHKDNIDLKSKLQNTEAEAKRLKDVEDSLFKTLKTAEDTGASIIEEANEAADQIINEANKMAETTTAQANELYQSALAKAQSQSDVIIGAAEKKARETIVDLRESMSDLVRSYENLAEQREALVKSLRRITQDSLNQIDLSEAHFSRLDAKAHKRAIEDLARSDAFTFGNIEQLSTEVEEEVKIAPEDIETHEEVQADAEVIEESVAEVSKETSVEEEPQAEVEEPTEEEITEEPVMESSTEVEEPVSESEEEPVKEEPVEDVQPNQEPEEDESKGSFFDKL